VHFWGLVAQSLERTVTNACFIMFSVQKIWFFYLASSSWRIQIRQILLVSSKSVHSWQILTSFSDSSFVNVSRQFSLAKQTQHLSAILAITFIWQLFENINAKRESSAYLPDKNNIFICLEMSINRVITIALKIDKIMEFMCKTCLEKANYDSVVQLTKELETKLINICPELCRYSEESTICLTCYTKLIQAR
jgi:hypothetical protein